MRADPRVRFAGVAPALVLLVAVAGGCGSTDDETVRRTPPVRALPAAPQHLPVLPTGRGDVRPGDRVRTIGTTLFVRGRRILLAPLRADEVAVVPGGVFFRNGTELWFTDLTRARPTGFDQVTSLVASADGRRIGFVDLGRGPKDSHGTREALVAAYDSATGALSVATYRGMGDPLTDDLRHLYDVSAPGVLGFTATGLRVRGATGGVYLLRPPG